MDLTKEEIMNNLKDPAWIRVFINTFLPHVLSVIEKKHRYWASERESVPVEREVEHFEERGVVLWAFDDHLVTKEFREWKEMVLFESGRFFILLRHHTWGAVRADFEAYADTDSSTVVSQSPLSEDDLELCKEKLTEKLLSAARKMPFYEHYELYESWDNPLAEKTTLKG